MKSFLLCAGLLALNTSLSYADNFLLNYEKPYNDTLKKAPTNWFNLDMTGDKVRGVSTEKAYQTILKGRPSKPVVVAVIDSGVDIEHEDLKDVLWKNEKEIPNNGIDDDKNGYVDDIYGWNFIGGKDGKNVNHDSYEMTRLYVKYKKMFEGKSSSSIAEGEKKQYEEYLSIKDKFEKKVQTLRQQLSMYSVFGENYKKAKRLMLAYLDTDELDVETLKSVDSEDQRIKASAQMLAEVTANGLTEERLQEYLDYFKDQMEYGYNVNFDPRNIVGDDYSNPNERYYGNNDVIGKGGDAKHGTHVAGIIAAKRGNGIGMDGVADNVRIMSIRAVPNGDERDKDIANAIRYAADNGARIINMSFGKSYSPDKKVVDEAMQYAASKNVLLIHAAGNDAKNLDKENNFPNKTTLQGTKIPSWLEIGAASWGDNNNFVGDFSNYGKKSVDLFAPGVDIYATTPNQKYESLSGTSMAAPVTSGVAAIVMSYFPELTAAQVREVLEKSVVKFPKEKIKKPTQGEEEEGKSPEMVEFSELSATGGLVNVYEAVKLAEVMAKKIKKG
ncbi:MAG: S8 family peptidase [Thermoflexibacteraceae bacterium]